MPPPRSGICRGVRLSGRSGPHSPLPADGRVPGALVLALLIGAACSATNEPNALPVSLRYVALGDSYTIGTSVASGESWPSQLVARLSGRLELVANLGVNG